MLFGHEFNFTDAPNRYGLPPFYSLHAWVWKDNPAGTFEMWNPSVHCGPGETCRGQRRSRLGVATRLYALQREDFLAAVTGHQAAHAAGQAIIEERLRRTEPHEDEFAGLKRPPVGGSDACGVATSLRANRLQDFINRRRRHPTTRRR